MRVTRKLGATNHTAAHHHPPMQAQALVESVALSVVAATGVFLILLGCTALLQPPKARSFLLGFAATPARHYAELAARTAIGIAFLLASPGLPGSTFYFVAGLVLTGTTAVLAVLPYRFHQTFARRSVPAAMQYLPLIGAVSLAAGLGVAWSVYAASAA